MRQLIERFDAGLDRIGAKLEQKEFQLPVDLVGGILFFLFSLWILKIMPEQVTVSEKDIVNGRAFPTMLMYVMMVCCLFLIGKEVVRLVRKEPLTTKTVNLLVEVKALVIFGILLVTYLISKGTGQFVAGAVFCCLAFLVYFRCKKPSYYAITLVIAVAIWAAFKFVLKVNF